MQPHEVEYCECCWCCLLPITSLALSLVTQATTSTLVQPGAGRLRSTSCHTQSNWPALTPHPSMGKEFDPKEACKKEACQIQTCLSRNAFNMARCANVIDNLKLCCQRDGQDSLHCQSIGDPK